MLHIWALKIKKVPWLPRRSVLLDGPEYWSSKNDMFQPSFTHTLSEINEITLWLRFVFYFSLSRSVWAVGCCAGRLGPRVDSQEDLTFLWDMFGEKSLHSPVKVKPCWCQILLVGKHMEKYFVISCFVLSSPILYAEVTRRAPFSFRLVISELYSWNISLMCDQKAIPFFIFTLISLL